MRTHWLSASLLAACLAAAELPADERDKEKGKAEQDKLVVLREKAIYPLKTCPVSGNDLASMGPALDLVVKGRLVRVCCGDCKDEVTGHADRVLAQIDKAYIAAQRAGYPLDRCPVSGDKLPEQPHDVLHGLRLVRLASKESEEKLRKYPGLVMDQIDQALTRKQKKDYPLDACPVSGKKLGEKGEPVDHLFHDRLVRLCCKGCVAKLEADPAAALAKIEAARKGAKAPEPQKAPAAPAEKLAVLHVDGMT